MSKKKKICIHNKENYCCYKKSKYFYKYCNKQYCNTKCKYRIYHIPHENNFNVCFLKTKGKLSLKIGIPINYKNFSEAIDGNGWTFQSTKKGKDVTIQIVINNSNSCIKFLSNDFDKNVYIDSGYLYIILNDVPEITDNKTPYNKMNKKITIKRVIDNNVGYLYLKLSLDKELVFPTIYKLFKNNNNKITAHKVSSNPQPSSEVIKQQIKRDIHVEAVVLSYNRKCINEEHDIEDVNAIIKLAQTNGNVINISIPASYCKECNQYIILKSDFKNAKKKGALLCEVIDKTPEYIEKHKNDSYYGTESRVHSLGYNVIKQGYNYSFAQRKIILANIMENYGVTKHEILSMLSTNILRKLGMPNYTEAVEKWRQDREFVENYERGSIPKVIIDKVVIGRRS